MIRRFAIALLLPVLAATLPSFVLAGGGDYYPPNQGIFCGLGAHFFPGHASSHPVAGPWYSYYPHEAYFTRPAPTAYPYWPTQMSTGHGAYGAPQAYQAYPGTMVPSYGNYPQYWGR